MKKIAYIAMGILVGIVFSTAGMAFADTVKSLVGKKVTGEYTVVVNGKTLSDKGAVIDSKANVPARALSEALGADVQVSGKTINITTEEAISDVFNDNSSTVVSQTNKYIGGTKASLEQLRTSTIENVLAPLKKDRDKIAKDLEEAKAAGHQDIASLAEERLTQYDADIAKYEAEIKLIDEALLTAK